MNFPKLAYDNKPNPADIYALSKELKNGESTGYMRRKGIGAYGVAKATLHYTNIEEACLLIPMYDEHKEIVNLQYIFDSPRKIKRETENAKGDAAVEEVEETDKIFIGGKKKKGRISLIGGDIWDPTLKPRRVYIAEGFATGATVHELTGEPVVIAFDAGNLKYAAETVRKIVGPEPTLVFATDDDYATSRAGEVNAIDAAYRVGNAAYVLPPFTHEEKAQRGKSISDFNDLARLEGGRERAREALTLQESWVWPSRRPTIDMTKGNESEVVKALMRSLASPRLSGNGGSEGPFRNGVAMAYVADGQLRLYDTIYLLQIVSERAVLVERNSKGVPKSVTAPKHIVEMLLKPENMGEYRPLRAVANGPAALRADGTLVTNPGYDPDMEVYLIGGSEEGTEVPSLDQCRADLDDAYAGMRTKSNVYKMVCLSHLLSLITTHLTAIRPAYLFCAPGQGFGKSTAAMINFMIAGIDVDNAGPPSLEWKAAEDGMEKQIAAAMVAGRELFFDNVDNGSELGLNCLSRVVTQPMLSFRVLGHTQLLTVANTRVTTFTGNNISVTNDLARRVMTVEFGGDNSMEDTHWNRVEWTRWYKAHRERYLMAALGLLSWWMRSEEYARMVEGREDGSGEDTVGFPEWERVVAGCIRWAYGVDITCILKDTYEEAQTDDAGRNAVRILAEVMEAGRKYTATELLVEIQRADMKVGSELVALIFKEGSRLADVNNRTLGIALGKIKGKKSPDGKLKLDRGRNELKINWYQMLRLVED